MNLHWRQAVYFTGFVAHYGPYRFEIRFHALKHIALRVYREFDPSHCLHAWNARSVRDAKGQAQAFLRNPHGSN